MLCRTSSALEMWDPWDLWAAAKQLQAEPTQSPQARGHLQVMPGRPRGDATCYFQTLELPLRAQENPKAVHPGRDCGCAKIW